MPKPRGKVDGRSVKHASINAGVVGTILSGWVVVDHIVDTVVKLDSAGLLPDAHLLLMAVEMVLSELGPWIGIGSLGVAGITLIYKALMTYS